VILNLFRDQCLCKSSSGLADPDTTSFQKKIPMQQWRKLRPVSIDGFMALNIINIADMIRREKDEDS